MTNRLNRLKFWPNPWFPTTIMPETMSSLQRRISWAGFPIRRCASATVPPLCFMLSTSWSRNAWCSFLTCASVCSGGEARGAGEMHVVHLADVHDVQFRAGVIGKADGGLGGQRGVLRAVGRQQDLRRKLAHLDLLLLCAPVPHAGSLVRRHCRRHPIA